MGSASISPCISTGLKVDNFCIVNILLALKDKIKQCRLHIVKTGTPGIVLELLANEIEFVGRSINLFHISNM